MAESITPSRRSFITGLVALVAAPAIVRASNLMPVKSYAITPEELLKLRMAEAYRVMREQLDQSLYGMKSRQPGLSTLAGWGHVETWQLGQSLTDILMRHATAKVCFEPGTAEVSPWQLTPNKNDVIYYPYLSPRRHHGQEDQS